MASKEHKYPEGGISATLQHSKVSALVVQTSQVPRNDHHSEDRKAYFSNPFSLFNYYLCSNIWLKNYWQKGVMDLSSFVSNNWLLSVFCNDPEGCVNIQPGLTTTT